MSDVRPFYIRHPWLTGWWRRLTRSGYPYTEGDTVSIGPDCYRHENDPTVILYRGGTYYLAGGPDDAAAYAERVAKTAQLDWLLNLKRLYGDDVLDAAPLPEPKEPPRIVLVAESRPDAQRWVRTRLIDEPEAEAREVVTILTPVDADVLVACKTDEVVWTGNARTLHDIGDEDMANISITLSAAYAHAQ